MQAVILLCSTVSLCFLEGQYFYQLNFEVTFYFFIIASHVETGYSHSSYRRDKNS